MVSTETNLVGGDFHHRNSPSIKGSKLNLVVLAAVTDMHNGSDIANFKTVVGEAGGQCHAVQLFDHAGRGYAVIKLGASVVSQSRLPISVRKRQRTAALQDARARSNVPDIAQRLGDGMSSWRASAKALHPPTQ